MSSWSEAGADPAAPRAGGDPAQPECGGGGWTAQNDTQGERENRGSQPEGTHGRESFLFPEPEIFGQAWTF